MGVKNYMARKTRDEVIKALEVCTSLNEKYDQCSKCPYCFYGKLNCIDELMKDSMHYLNNPSSGVFNPLDKQWCISTLKDLETISYTEYLAWQEPLHAEDSGYFWTQRGAIKELLKEGMNTPEHPFIFNSRKDAIDHLKTLNIPYKCRIIRWR